MARKSGWQQFSENFSSAYGTVNKFGRDGADRDIMDQEIEEQFDEAGASTGFNRGGIGYGSRDEASIARMRELSANASRYGDTKGAIDMESKISTIESQGLANKLSRVENENKMLAAQRSANTNKTFMQYSQNNKDGMSVEDNRQYLLDAARGNADEDLFKAISNFDAFDIKQKMNDTAQLIAGADRALSKGQAGGSKELLALVDGMDGVEGNIKFVTGENGSVSMVELDPEGNPTNARPWEGKNWEDFAQNVRKRLSPQNALAITTKQVGITKDNAAIGLIEAQTVEALRKAAGSGNQDKVDLIKVEAVAKFQQEVGGDYSRAKGAEAKKAVLDMFKYELGNALNQRNKDGSYNQPNRGGVKPVTGGNGDKGTLGKLSNLSNTTGEPTPTGGLGGTQEDKAPAPKKVLTGANVAELKALDAEGADIQQKVVELSKARGLQSGGNARNEIQKLRKRLTGIEQRKYKIQN